MVYLRPKFRGQCSFELPVFVDNTFELHRSGVLAGAAILQGFFLIAFYIILRVPSCSDVVGNEVDSVETLMLWILQVTSILLNLFSNNRYNSALWLLLSLGVTTSQITILGLTSHWCLEPALQNAGLSGSVLSTLSSSFPDSFPCTSNPS